MPGDESTPPSRSVAVASARRGELRALAVEWLLRCFAAATYVVMLVGIVSIWRLDTSRYSLLLLLASEGFTLALVLTARLASVRDASLRSVLATSFAASHFAFYGYTGTLQLIPEPAAQGAQLAGLTLQLWAKASLGRSFGVLPAARGVVTRGAYRFVRHPIYAGYLTGGAGFLLANLSWRNVLVFAALVAAQWARIHREEAMLASVDGGVAYRLYCQAVPCRLFPRWI